MYRVRLPHLLTFGGYWVAHYWHRRVRTFGFKRKHHCTVHNAKSRRRFIRHPVTLHKASFAGGCLPQQAAKLARKKNTYSWYKNFFFFSFFEWFWLEPIVVGKFIVQIEHFTANWGVDTFRDKKSINQSINRRNLFIFTYAYVIIIVSNAKILEQKFPLKRINFLTEKSVWFDKILSECFVFYQNQWIPRGKTKNNQLELLCKKLWSMPDW